MDVAAKVSQGTEKREAPVWNPPLTGKHRQDCSGAARRVSHEHVATTTWRQPERGAPREGLDVLLLERCSLLVAPAARSQNAVVQLVRCEVATARTRLQALAVEDRDLAAAVANQ
jgi:hypothetical protein